MISSGVSLTIEESAFKVCHYKIITLLGIYPQTMMNLMNWFAIKWGKPCYKLGQVLQSKVTLLQSRARVVCKLRKYANK